MSSRREMLITDAVTADRMPLPIPRDWWRGMVLYEIYWRSFCDTNGDGIGDLKGVTSKLGYIAGLGVDAIWLAPIFASPQEDFGYDVSDARSVDPRAGTMDDFLQLLEVAHGHGLRVLIDFVPVHTSHRHPWFLASRKDTTGERADWYVWADAAADGCPPNNWLSSFGGSAWSWEPRRAQYYYHPFLPCQPALNLRNPKVLDAVLDDMRFWLDLGVDGFRVDAVQCLASDADLRANPPAPRSGSPVPFGGGPNNLFRRQQHLFDRDVPESIPMMERMRALADTYGPDRVLVGELAEVDASRTAEKYTVYKQRFHAIYDFDLINFPAEDIPRIIRARDAHLRTGWAYNAFTNHDSQRAVSNMTPFAKTRDAQVQAAKMLIFLQFTLKGGGTLYQGEELGLVQPELRYEDLRDPWGINLWPDFEGRDGVRTPMPWEANAPYGGFSSVQPWLPFPEMHRVTAVDRQEHDPDSVLHFVRVFLAWRKTHPLLLWGDETMHEGNAPLIVFERFAGNERLHCIVNFSMQARLYPLPAGCTLLDAPCSGVHKTEQGLHLPPLGFAVCMDVPASRSSADALVDGGSVGL